TIQPGEHGSTYGGNPLACRVAMTALEVLQEEKMAENAVKMGAVFRKGMEDIHSPLVKEVRGKGLLNAIVIDHENKHAAWDICLLLRDKGLLAKPTQGDKIRFAPPLIINEEQMQECIGKIKEALETF